MPLWLWILMLAALIKLPIAALMLWIPFRNDEAMRVPEGLGLLRRRRRLQGPARRARWTRTRAGRSPAGRAAAPTARPRPPRARARANQVASTQRAVRTR